MFKRIDHVALHVGELDRSVAFYERHFGFKNYFSHTVPNGPRIAYLRLGDTVLELTEHSDNCMGGFHFCLETTDFDATVSQLERDGIALVRAPHPTAAREPREKGWRRVVFRGPDGEQIELRG
jgi:lactoylglutathione lyase